MRATGSIRPSQCGLQTENGLRVPVFGRDPLCLFFVFFASGKGGVVARFLEAVVNVLLRAGLIERSSVESELMSVSFPKSSLME